MRKKPSTVRQFWLKLAKVNPAKVIVWVKALKAMIDFIHWLAKLAS